MILFALHYTLQAAASIPAIAEETEYIFLLNSEISFCTIFNIALKLGTNNNIFHSHCQANSNDLIVAGKLIYVYAGKAKSTDTFY